VRASLSYFVYILASQKNGTLYTGVTNDLARRVWEHRQGKAGFAGKYGALRLVWFEEHPHIDEAITREKRIKRWLRPWKIDLIESVNPGWRDLYHQLQL
jgi:putative endonuclease